MVVKLAYGPCGLRATVASGHKKLRVLPVRAASVWPNCVFEPAIHWVGHQKDGVITEATDG